MCCHLSSYVSKVEGARFTPTNLGLALFVSYSRLGLELGKPYLRAAMELECVAVAQGTKSRQAVVDDCIKEVLAVRGVRGVLFTVGSVVQFGEAL